VVALLLLLLLLSSSSCVGWLNIDGGFKEIYCLYYILLCVKPCRSDKDAFVSSLFQPKRPAPTGPLVEDLDAPTTFPNSTCDAKVAPPIPPVEEKSMLELMMEEQKAAKREKEKLQEKERAKMSKDIGSGFKKGFFGGGSKPTKKPPSASAAPAAATKPATKSAKADEIVTLSKPKANANIVNNGAAGDKKDTSGLVMEDVQEAMRADENPVLQDLKKGGRHCLIYV